MSRAAVPNDDLSYNERRRIWEATDGPHGSASEFGDMYNVNAWVLPFAGRVTDPIKILSEVATYLSGRPPGAQRVTQSNLQGSTDINKGAWSDTPMMDKILLTHGWWRGGKSSSGPYYCNPDYYHRHPESDTFRTWEERAEFFADAAAVGIIDPQDIAPAFGIRASTPEYAGNSVTSIAHRCEFPWKERRDAGRHRLLRTWATLSEWGYTKADIARAFGVHRTTVSKWLSRTEFEQEIPDDPTWEVMECR